MYLLVSPLFLSIGSFGIRSFFHHRTNCNKHVFLRWRNRFEWRWRNQKEHNWTSGLKIPRPHQSHNFIISNICLLFPSFNSSCPEDQEYAESLYTRDLLSTTPFLARMIQWEKHTTKKHYVPSIAQTEAICKENPDQCFLDLDRLEAKDPAGTCGGPLRGDEPRPLPYLPLKTTAT